ncbi:MAG: hypothetical protein WC866_05250 [Patescibacteria group bacterium]|jgi:hypothetical protein
MNIFTKLFKSDEEQRKQSPIGSYTVEVVSLPEELDWEAHLPIELRYLFSKRPETKERLRALLSAGKAIGVRTVKRTPERMLEAVKHISFYSQHNCILTWLPELLRDKHLPLFTPADLARAKEHGADLHNDVNVILESRLAFKRLVLIDEENIGIGTEEQRFMRELSEIIYPLAIDTIVHRAVIDNANERTEIAQNIIKAMLVIGPIAHVLEKYVSGLGKLFAASTDDLLGESAELMALRGSGFSWKELRKRFVVLVPVFALATYAVFQVEPLLEHGKTLTAGAVFGLSAVALSLTTAIQSIGMYLGSVRALKKEGKIHTHGETKSDLWIAIVQDFTNPARLGLLLGASMAPFMGMIAAVLGLMHNGWILALVGSTEGIVAGLTVIYSNRINAWRFRRSLERRIG